MCCNRCCAELCDKGHYSSPLDPAIDDLGALDPVRFLKKLKSDKDPKFVERLPSLPPGSLGTCAIIGNADNLLRHKWGREIDMHDFVVRFNVKMQVCASPRLPCTVFQEQELVGLLEQGLSSTR